MDTSSGDSPRKSGLTPQADKSSWRRHLVDQRLRMGDHEDRSDWLQRVLRVWLVERSDTVIGAYWPIKGEFDVLPALFRWQEAGREGDALEAPIQRGIGLPVMNPEDKTLKFHAWYPGVPWSQTPTVSQSRKGLKFWSPPCCLSPVLATAPAATAWAMAGGFTTEPWRNSRQGHLPWGWALRMHFYLI